MRNIVFALVLFTSLVAIGCATTKKIAADITGTGSALQKKIALFPSANTTGYGGEHCQEEIEAQLKTFLGSRCNGLLVIDSADIRNALRDIPRLASGQRENLAMATVGRTHGLNAVLEQRIGDVQGVTEKRGIWGSGDTRMLARLSLSIRAYDVETTAVLFDEAIEESVELSQDDWQRLESAAGQYDKEIARRLFGKIIPKIGSRLCKRLAEQPWKGYIVSSAGNTFTLTTGKDVGLAAGNVLEVFAAGGRIEGHSGQVYLISGPKIGEIKITEVQTNQAKAIGISGSNLEKSSYVKLKP